MPVFYDDALPIFAQIVSKAIGDEALLANLFLRDASGRIALIVRHSTPPDKLSKIADEAATRLRPYVANAEEAVSSSYQMFDESLAHPDAGRIEYIQHPSFSGFVRVIERRIVGHDWLSPPRDPIPGLPPIVVFSSHKGGVGRSTALAVTASDFASSNLNVLAVDLDLEAPGVGGRLLNESSQPEFGSLDYFVENGLQPIEKDFLEQLVGVSPLTQGKGVVHIVPATGRRSHQNPENVLGKISRAYLDDTSGEGHAKTFLDQARDLLSAIAGINRYDVILVDVRAGLNETTAAAILGLGADVLLFGVNTPQTFEGYRYLLSHLAWFKPEPTVSTDWRLRLKMIHAKAAANPNDWKTFRESSFTLFSEQLYDLDESGDAFNFDIDDAQAPHNAWTILNDSNYFEFNPLQNQAQLSGLLYERTFGSMVSGLRDRLGFKKANNA